jgi:hypothetical protein
MAKDPRYMSFDHQYVETVTVTDTTALANGIERCRFVKRSGAYPAAGGYAAGVNIFKLYGQGVLTEKGYQVENASMTQLTGTLGIATTGVVTGSSTVFETELEVGSTIQVGGALFRVMEISSDTSAVVSPAPAVAVAPGASAFIWPGTYEGQSNPSTTPRKPGVFPYQGLMSVVTTGIAIVEVDATSTFAVDDAVYSTTSGTASSTAGGKVVLGRCLDVISTAGAGQFIRVKLGNEAGAQTN